MGGLIDSVFGDNKGPTTAEQNAQAAQQSQADRDYEAKIFEERDAAARVREAEGHANELERLRIKEQKLRQRESEETIQGLGIAGTADITLGNDDELEVQDVSGTEVVGNSHTQNMADLDETLNAGTGLII